MRGWVRSGVAALLSSGLIAMPVGAAQAAEPAAACTAPAPVTGVLAPWNAPMPLNAGGSADKLAAASLSVGQAVRLTLLPTPQVHFASASEKPGAAASYGGLVGLTVDRAGTYRVALGSPAWVDLVADGKPVGSVAHGHGPDCSGISKMVDFPLQPGRYVVQLSANGAAQTSLLVVRLP